MTIAPIAKMTNLSMKQNNKDRSMYSSRFLYRVLTAIVHLQAHPLQMKI